MDIKDLNKSMEELLLSIEKINNKLDWLIKSKEIKKAYPMKEKY